MKKNILRENDIKNIFSRKTLGFYAHNAAQGSQIAFLGRARLKRLV